MDRLLSLRNSEGNSSCNNTSQSSELGYETARDDSLCSMYYSMDDDSTVTSIDDDDLNVSSHSQLTVVPSTSPPLRVVNDAITSVQTGLSAQSYKTVPIELAENLDRPIVSANSTVARTHSISDAEHFHLPFESSTSSITTSYSTFVGTGRSLAPIESSKNLYRTIDKNLNLPSESTTTRENLDHIILNSVFTNTAPSAENSLQPFGMSMIRNLPPLPEVSTINGTNNYNSSSAVQAIHVVTIDTQEKSGEVPRQTRATRSTIVKFQSNDLPRRQTIMPRRTLRDTRNEVVPSNGPVVVAGPSNLGRKSVLPTNHVCDICKKSFLLRTTLLIHKTSHKTNCKYCDRSFKKSIALSNHLKENCEKIPAAARRKILANEYKEKMMTT